MRPVTLGKPNGTSLPAKVEFLLAASAKIEQASRVADDPSPFGYSAGEGGAETQAASKSAGVTLDKRAGAITMNGAALNAGVSVSFTLTNSTIGANDVVVVSIKSGAAADSYSVDVTAVAAGSCRIQVRNFTGGNLSEALVLSFVVISGAAA